MTMNGGPKCFVCDKPAAVECNCSNRVIYYCKDCDHFNQDDRYRTATQRSSPGYGSPKIPPQSRSPSPTRAGLPPSGRPQTSRGDSSGKNMCRQSPEYGPPSPREPSPGYGSPPVPPQSGSPSPTLAGLPPSGRPQTPRRDPSGTKICQQSPEYGPPSPREPSPGYGSPPVPPYSGFPSPTRANLPPSGRPQTPRRDPSGTNICQQSPEYGPPSTREPSPGYRTPPVPPNSGSTIATHAGLPPSGRPQTLSGPPSRTNLCPPPFRYGTPSIRNPSPRYGPPPAPPNSRSTYASPSTPGSRPQTPSGASAGTREFPPFPKHGPTLTRSASLGYGPPPVPPNLGTPNTPYTSTSPAVSRPQTPSGASAVTRESPPFPRHGPSLTREPSPGYGPPPVSSNLGSPSASYDSPSPAVSRPQTPSGAFSETRESLSFPKHGPPLTRSATRGYRPYRTCEPYPGYEPYPILPYSGTLNATYASPSSPGSRPQTPSGAPETGESPPFPTHGTPQTRSASRGYRPYRTCEPPPGFEPHSIPPDLGTPITTDASQSPPGSRPQTPIETSAGTTECPPFPRRGPPTREPSPGYGSPPVPPNLGTISALRVSPSPPGSRPQTPLGASAEARVCSQSPEYRPPLTRDPHPVTANSGSPSITRAGQPPSERPKTPNEAPSESNKGQPHFGDGGRELKCAGCGYYPNVVCFTCCLEPIIYCNACFLYYHPPGYAGTASHKTKPLF